jgi:hypothetical protein
VPVEGFADARRRLIDNEAERRELEARGFGIMRGRRLQTDMLQAPLHALPPDILPF